MSCVVGLVVLVGLETLSAQCGVERWSVKTGTDSGAGAINLNSSSSTTIASLRSLTAPNPIPSNSRVSPTETKQWVINATLTKYKLESDSDYHLVITDSSGRTMIVEIPSPSCVGAGSPFVSGIQRARSEFNAKFSPTTSFKTTNTPVQVTGIGLFDFLHGQTGVAPNGIELHPVLSIVFNPGTAQPLNAVSPSIAADPSTAGQTTLTLDDDGGRVQIVPVDASSQSDKQAQRGSRTSPVQQVSIFLGSGWGDPETRSRESILTDLTAVHGNVQASDIIQDDIAILRAVPPQEDFSDLSGAPINDLFIQGKLSELLKSNALPAPTPASIYVIFLGPGLNSTLGGLKAGEGYAAYHNFVNLDQGEVRYVVVPFQQDLGRQAAAAARALAEAGQSEQVGSVL
jgi:hypothetical protein